MLDGDIKKKQILNLEFYMHLMSFIVETPMQKTIY